MTAIAITDGLVASENDNGTCCHHAQIIKELQRSIRSTMTSKLG